MAQAQQKSRMMTTKEVAFMATQIGFSVAVTCVFFVAGGKYLDSIFNLSPLFTLSGIALGLIAALYLVWQIVKPLQQKYQTDFKVLKKEDAEVKNTSMSKSPVKGKTQ